MFIILRAKSEMNHQISELRYYDRVGTSLSQTKQLTLPNPEASLSQLAFRGLLSLLEGVDTAKTPNYVKFYSRTYFLGLAVRGGDSISEDMMASNVKSCVYHAYEACSNPQEFDAFLNISVQSDLLPYFLSMEHQQIQEDISQLTGVNFVMSTPYEFASVVNNHVHILNFERSIGYMIDFALTIQTAFKFSAEEIFVGCCLAFWQQNNSAILENLLMNYFEPSLERGLALKLVITEELEKCLNEEV